MKVFKRGCLCLCAVLLLAGCTSQNSAQEAENKVDMTGFTELNYALFSPDIQEGGLLLIQDPKTDLKGAIDLSGEVVIEPEHYDINSFHEALSFVYTKDRSDCYYINTQGEKVIEKVDGKSIVYGRPFDASGETAVILSDNGSNEQYAVIDRQGKVILYKAQDGSDSKIFNEKDPKSYSVMVNLKPSEIFQNKWILDPDAPITFYSDKERYGIFDNANKTFVTELIYNVVTPFYDGHALVVDKDYKMLLIDDKGQEVVHLSKKYPGLDFEMMPALTKDGAGLRFLEEGKGVIILDAKGNEVARKDYYAIGLFSNGFASVVVSEEGVFKYGLIDAKGEEILPPVYDAVGNVYEGKVVVRANDKWYIVDLSKKA